MCYFIELCSLHEDLFNTVNIILEDLRFLKPCSSIIIASAIGDIQLFNSWMYFIHHFNKRILLQLSDLLLSSFFNIETINEFFPSAGTLNLIQHSFTSCNNLQCRNKPPNFTIQHLSRLDSRPSYSLISFRIIPTLPLQSCQHNHYSCLLHYSHSSVSH